MAENAAWLVPVILVGVQFLFKLFVGEEASILSTWREWLQNPVDIGFLALSFVATIIISDASRAADAFVVSLIYVILLIISIIIWKSSPKDVRHARKAGLLLILNYVIAIPMLVYSIQLLGDQP